MKKLLCFALTIAALAASSSVLADESQGFSKRGHSVIVADHLFGLLYYKESSSQSDWLVSIGATDMRDKIEGSSALSTPRLGYHHFIGNTGLSLGAGFSYLTVSSGSDNKAYAIAPRVGYAVAVSQTVGWWLRTGITYGKGYNGVADFTTTAFGSELQIVVTPCSHFGILIGPMAEIGLSGSYDNKRSGYSGSGSKATLFGLTMGVLADF